MLFWVAISLLIGALYFAALFVTILFFFSDKKRQATHAQCYWWADAVIALNPSWKISVSGLENIDKNRAYVIVANHQSMADIIIMYKIKSQFKWVSKESLFKIPFLGWTMSLSKHIRLSRGELSSIRNVYREAVHWLRSGMSVVFFPEGTRSDTNEMRQFQTGAFKLAIKEKVPVLPIAIRGTRYAIPKTSWLIEATKVTASLTVLPPIDTSGFQSKDVERLHDIVRSALERA